MSKNYPTSSYDSSNISKGKTRIYGIDPGIISDIETINNLDEVNLYFMIDLLGTYINKTKQNIESGKTNAIDLTEEEYTIEYMIYQTTKFGVELEEPEIGKHIVPTPSYKAWFQFYDNHFKNILTTEEWNAFQYIKRCGLDTSAFMPVGNWKTQKKQKL